MGYRIIRCPECQSTFVMDADGMSAMNKHMRYGHRQNKEEAYDSVSDAIHVAMTNDSEE